MILLALVGALFEGKKIFVLLTPAEQKVIINKNIMINPKVDFFFNKAKKWQDAYLELRRIILECDLKEELKWGVPCYTYDAKNVILIHGFKEYCAVLFHKGVLLKDKEQLLIQQTENVQSARQIRFISVEEVLELEKVLKSYIKEAIEVEEKGLKVELKKLEDYKIPEEFENALSSDKELKKAFETLTPGRQKSYIFYFSQAKQAKTREARIEKYYDKILDGKGMDD